MRSFQTAVPAKGFISSRSFKKYKRNQGSLHPDPDGEPCRL